MGLVCVAALMNGAAGGLVRKDSLDDLRNVAGAVWKDLLCDGVLVVLCRHHAMDLLHAQVKLLCRIY